MTEDKDCYNCEKIKLVLKSKQPCLYARRCFPRQFGIIDYPNELHIHWEPKKGT